jgi:hypothetical protein
LAGHGLAWHRRRGGIWHRIGDLNSAEREADGRQGRHGKDSCQYYRDSPHDFSSNAGMDSSITEGVLMLDDYTQNIFVFQDIIAKS